MRPSRWLYTIPLRLRALFRRSAVEQDLSDEFAWHFEQRMAEEMTRGVSREEARHAALRAMDGMAQRQEECRDARRLNLLDSLAQDLRYALRTLRNSPGFALVAVLSLALGIGANTAVFSLIDGLLLRRIPVTDPDRLVNIDIVNTGLAQAYLTYPLFSAVRERNAVFSRTFAWSQHDFQTMMGGEMLHVAGIFASGDYFPGLAVNPVEGRFFTPADDLPDGGPQGPVTVISAAFRDRRFGLGANAVGQAINLDGVRFTVIGVMPRGFFGAETGTNPQIWVPLRLDERLEGPGCMNNRSCWWLVAMARLKPGVSREQASAHLGVLAAGIMKDTVPNCKSCKARYLNQSLEAVPGATGFSFLRVMFSNPLAILMGLVGVVLLIACANMANLLLARGSARHREIAIRLAMGAARGRIMRQLLTESIMISLTGATAGFVFSLWATRMLVSFLSTRREPVLLNLKPDWRVLGFTAAAAIGAGLLFGLLPALRATRAGISTGLRERAGNLRTADGRVGAARAILAVQVALSVLLVAGAGLFAGSLIRLWTLDPGFDARHVLLIGIDTEKRPEKEAALTALYQRLLERVSTFPGVRAASVVTIRPLSMAQWDEDVYLLTAPDIAADQRDTYFNLIGPHYFAAMGTRILAGREFTESDNSTVDRGAVITENAARAWFGTRNPIGQQIRFEEVTARIIGVVANARYINLREPEPRTLYFDYAQNPKMVHSMSFVIRDGAELAPLVPAFRAALRNVAPDVPLSGVETLSEQANESLSRERLMASLSVFFGLLALLLTSIGLYGILSYAVARRTPEIGVRMALGAQRSDVLRLVVRETFAHVLLGMIIGVIAVLATARLAASLLYGVTPTDPVTLAMALAVLAAVAAIAALIPARRATRLDPMTALREE